MPQWVRATGPLSSANPNLQNIPIRTEMGQRIRKAFVAGPGNLLVVADYSQIELRILAHIADEQALIEAFTKGEDIHRATAATVFGINFGIVYGMSAFGLSQALGICTKEADKFITAYLDRYPGVRRYVEETEKSAEKEGKVATLSGRVRWLPDITTRTASSAKAPAAWRSTPASRAPPPTSSRRP
jgi:DNA polymerase-1